MRLHGDPPSRGGRETFYTSHITSQTYCVINTTKQDFFISLLLDSQYISLDVHSNGVILPAHIHCIANDSSLSLLFILIWIVLLLSTLLLIYLPYAFT